MENLPKDPAILQSYINMKLRDQYSSLEDMCDDLHINPAELMAHMKSLGLEYSPEAKRFY
ncbi:MAG: DUF4250 domain-containing protein [Muribaculaceae bacterium]|nr:DUF4250 domain-containing protein [Muribaculaceae bacterium]